jgi:hypothetical protein
VVILWQISLGKWAAIVRESTDFTSTSRRFNAIS